MRRIGGIGEQVVALDNLYTAYCKARQGKRRRPDVAQFSLDPELNLPALQRELEAGASRLTCLEFFLTMPGGSLILSMRPVMDTQEGER